MSVISKTQGTIERITFDQPLKWRWYHGVAFYIIAQTLTFGLSGLTNKIRGNKSNNLRDAIFGDVSYFKRLKQSVITPPASAFGPAWTINNISVIYGNLRVLNMPHGTKGRDAYLALQAASWFNFIVFSAAYFSLRSPINAFLLTFSMFWLTLASGIIAIVGLKDTKVALSLATLMLWLTIALTAGSFQALWNRDEFYKAGPFADPIPALVRDAR